MNMCIQSHDQDDDQENESRLTTRVMSTVSQAGRAVDSHPVSVAIHAVRSRQTFYGRHEPKHKISLLSKQDVR